MSRTSGAFILGIALLTAGAGTASAANTGGAAAGSSTSSKHSTNAPAAPVVPPGAAPITSKSSNIAYHGPVYERNAAGQVVPYEPATVTATAEVSSTTGGSAVTVVSPAKPDLLVPGARARYIEGLAAAPMSAPVQIQEIVWGANQIIGLPYIYGGGHASFISPGYDCSGTVSFALHGAALLTVPEDSSEFMHWGSAGRGALGDDLLQPRTRLHDRGRAAAGHQLRRRPQQPAGSPLAPVAPRQQQLHRSPPARAVDPACRAARVG